MKGPQDNRTAAADIAGSTGRVNAGGPAAAGTYRAGKLHIAGVKLEGYKLLEQRIEATMKLMDKGTKINIRSSCFGRITSSPIAWKDF